MKHLFSLFLTILVAVSASAALTVRGAAGWQESAWMEFNGLSASYSIYNAYVSADNGANWTVLDGELVRSYGTYGRVDALGLAAGNYLLKVVPCAADSSEIAADAVTSSALTVANYDRSGFAHTGKYATTTGVGAYNNDGTLKANAVVLYITNASAHTVSMNVTGATTNPCVGLQSIISGYEKGQETRPLAVRFIGEVTALDSYGSSEEGLQVKGRRADSELNMTFEGVGNDAFIHGFGFLVRNSASVEFRNLGIATDMDDDLSLDTDNDHIWIHNLDVYYGHQGSGDHAKGDGAIDVKSDSKHVTIAYCHFWDTGKSTMCGMKSESGPNYITYHHNWFDHSDSRHARIRTMSVHMYNNYFDGNAKYCVGATTGSSVFVENNYFLNCPKPMLISKQGTDIHMGVGSSDETNGTFSGEDGGIIKSFGNTYVGSKTLVTYQTNTTHFDCWEATSRTATVPATVTTLQGNHTYDNFDTNASLMYAYTPDAAADVPAIVTGDLGAGRLQHGDLQFTFTDADNADYNVNPTIRTALDTYTSSLIAIIGNHEIATTPGTDPENPGTVVGGNVCHFTGNTPSNSQVVVNGSYSNSKGSVTYEGTEYAICVKMESSTDIVITPVADCDITLIFGGNTAAGGKKFKLDGVAVTLDANGQHTFAATAGTAYHVTKSDGIFLFLVLFSNTDPENPGTNPGTDPEEPAAIPSVQNFAPVKVLVDGRVLILRAGVLYDLSGRRL